MSREQVGVVGFRIEGSYLTSLVRDYVREGDWRKGYSLLMEGLEGIESQMVLDILSGKSKLVGVNELDVEPDDAEAAVKASLDYQFRHCFKFRGRVFRAYGYVGMAQRADWYLALRIARNDDADMLRNVLWRQASDQLDEKPTVKAYSPWKKEYGEALRYRSAFYAADRQRDISVEVNLPQLGCYPVLFEEYQCDVPLWYVLPTHPGDVARQAYAQGQLPDLYFNAEAPEDAWMSRPRVRFDNSSLPVDAEAEDEEDEAAAEAEVESRMELYRQKIAAVADADTEYGWRELSEYDKTAGRNVTLRVPGRAFICAALGRARAHHLMPDYTPVTYSGMKMLNDDPYHTDAWIGAGMSPDTAYDDDLPEQRLFMTALYDLQRDKLNFAFDVLARSDKSYVSGEVIHDPALADAEKVLVLKSADPQFADAALRCAAVIVETGSKLAHLVVVSREAAVPVIRQAKACETLRPGRRVYINLSQGSLDLSPI